MSTTDSYPRDLDPSSPQTHTHARDPDHCKVKMEDLDGYEVEGSGSLGYEDEGLGSLGYESVVDNACTLLPRPLAKLAQFIVIFFFFFSEFEDESVPMANEEIIR